MRAKTWRAVVAAAGFDSGGVELVDGGSVGGGEGHMNGSGQRFPSSIQKSPPPSMANPGPRELSTTGTAWELAGAWPDAHLITVGDSGHTGSDRMRAAALAATERFKPRFTGSIPTAVEGHS